MNTRKMDEWAAKFIGEDEDLIPDAVDAEWYTKHHTAAFVLLAKSAEEGHDVELAINGGTVEVKCGAAVETGTFDELALLITRACYACHNG